MSTQVQIRRGNTAQTAAFTGAIAELTVDTDKKVVVVHDGTTAGGIPLSKESTASTIFNHANGAFDKANSANVLAQAGYNQANTATTSAQAAFDKANQTAQLAFTTVSANGTSLVADANNDTLTITSAVANGIFVSGNSSTDALDIGLINSGVTASGYGDSISVSTFVVDAKGRLTSASNTTIRSGTTSQTGVVQLEDSVTSTSTSNASTPASVKTTYDLATTANNNAVNAGTYANAAFAKANSANVIAQAAFDNSNTKFNSSGGSISGDVSVTGNLTIIGQTIYANTTTALIADNIITLNAAINQASAPTVDAGFEIDRGSSANVSLLWNETSDKWTFTNDGTNYLNIADAGRLDSSFNHANGAFTVANSATTTAQNAYNLANGTAGVANTDFTTISATAGVYGNASHVPVTTLTANGRVSSITNTAIAIDTAALTSGTIADARLPATGTAGTYANASHVPVITTDAYGRVSGVTNTAIAIDTAAITSGTLADARLPTKGTAGTYANTTHVPVITTDAYGRVTAVTNTAISFPVTSVGGQTGAVSNTQLLNSILAVDGVGSGLDADLLDGFSHTAFANATFANTRFSSSGGSITGDVTVTGNLTIVGQTVYANTTTALIADNIITLNAAIGQASAPTVNAGIEVDRGSSANVLLLWNETTDKWQFTNDGSTYFDVADAGRLDSVFSLANGTAGIANTDYTTISTSSGVYGNTAYLPVVTLAANGRVSSITNTAIAISADAVTSGTLAVTRGGTGVTTSTGTGAVVLNTSPTLSNVSVTGLITVSDNVRANYVVANTAFASAAGLSKLELSDIGLVGITVAGQTYQFGGSGIESNQGIFGGSFGGNRLSLNNETNLISNRYDTVKIQTGTTGTAVNDFVFANNTFSAPGIINVASRVDFTGSGYAQPSFTNRSAGQKITLYPAITGSLVDYSIGIDGGVLWSTVPAATTSYQFKWYGGESEIASLRGDGLFTTISANITSTTASTSNTTGALKVAGGIGVKGNVSANGIIFDDGTRQTTAASGGATLGDVLALSIALG